MQRIFHIDLNFLMYRKEKIRELLERVADIGYNAILWEVEDKIRWESCPECVHPEAFTKEEFSELLAYSRSLGLEPIPLLQTLGHAEYVLSHEEYEPFREIPTALDCYCVQHLGVRNLLKMWIEEYVELFGDIHDFHLGGDEAYWFGKCPKCEAVVQKNGTISLAMMHYATISEYLIRNGIRPNLWMDLVLQHPDEVKPHLPLLKKFRFWDWHYSRGFGGDFSSLESLLNLGLNVVPCSAVRAWGDRLFAPRNVRAGNVAATAAEAVKRNLSGYCTTSWSIRIVNYDLQLPIIALAPLAEQNPDLDLASLWRKSLKNTFPNDADADDFVRALTLAGTEFPLSTVHEFGVGKIYKSHIPMPEGWFAEQLKKDAEAHGKADFAAAEKDLAEARTILQRLSGIDAGFCAPYIEAIDMEEDLLKFSKMILARSPEGPAFAKELRKKAASVYGKWQTPFSAETCSRTLFGAVLDYFKSVSAEL